MLTYVFIKMDFPCPPFSAPAPEVDYKLDFIVHSLGSDVWLLRPEGFRRRDWQVVGPMSSNPRGVPALVEPHSGL